MKDSLSREDMQQLTLAANAILGYIEGIQSSLFIQMRKELVERANRLAAILEIPKIKETK